MNVLMYVFLTNCSLFILIYYGRQESEWCLWNVSERISHVFFLNKLIKGINFIEAFELHATL